MNKMYAPNKYLFNKYSIGSDLCTKPCFYNINYQLYVQLCFEIVLLLFIEVKIIYKIIVIKHLFYV